MIGHLLLLQVGAEQPERPDEMNVHLLNALMVANLAARAELVVRYAESNAVSVAGMKAGLPCALENHLSSFSPQKLFDQIQASVSWDRCVIFKELPSISGNKWKIYTTESY